MLFFFRSLNVNYLKHADKSMPTRVFILLTIVLFLAVGVHAQQEPQFSHNMFNNMHINPGLAGMRNAICATALARQQWVGFRDYEGNRVNPETYNLNVDAPIRLIRGGLALGFMQDQLGWETTTGFNFAYSYHHNLNVGRLGIGARIGFLDKRIDFGGLEPYDSNDPALSSGDENHIFIDFSFGTFYMLDDEFWAGLSATQLRQATGLIGDRTEYSLRRHIYATAGYNYTLPGHINYMLSPSTLVKTDFSSVQIDVNAIVTYNNRFYTGVSYRPQDAVVILLGVKLDQISIGYSYDVTTSPLGSMGRSYGSHEIMLQYCFDLDIDKIQEIQRNIRFL